MELDRGHLPCVARRPRSCGARPESRARKATVTIGATRRVTAEGWTLFPWHGPCFEGPCAFVGAHARQRGPSEQGPCHDQVPLTCCEHFGNGMSQERKLEKLLADSENMVHIALRAHRYRVIALERSHGRVFHLQPLFLSLSRCWWFLLRLPNVIVIPTRTTPSLCNLISSFGPTTPSSRSCLE